MSPIRFRCAGPFRPRLYGRRSPIVASALAACLAAVGPFAGPAHAEDQNTYFDPLTRLPTADDRLWHLDRIDQDAVGSEGLLKGLLDKTYQYCAATPAETNTVYVYVIDSGVLADHQEFQLPSEPGGPSQSKILPGHDFTRERESLGLTGPDGPYNETDPCFGAPRPVGPNPDPADVERYRQQVINAGHGTSVASLINGTWTGVAKSAKIIPLRISPCSQYAARLWRGSIPYELNHIVIDNGNYFVCTKGGRSGVTKPNFGTDVVQDNTVTWTRITPPPVDLDPDDAGIRLAEALEWITSTRNPYLGHKPALVSLSTWVRRNQTSQETANRIIEAVEDSLNENIAVIASANNQDGDACDYLPGAFSRGNQEFSGHKAGVITVGGSMLLNWADEKGRGDGGSIPGQLEADYDPGRRTKDVLWKVGPGDSVSSKEAAGSNHGRCVTIFAPAKNITSASIDHSYRDRLGAASDPLPPYASGTSFSAPIVAGVAARFLEMRPEATAEEVYKALINTAIEGALDPATLNGSDNYLVRASDIMFVEQAHPVDPVSLDDGHPPEFAPGSTVVLTAKVATVGGSTADVRYQWFQGMSGDTTTPLGAEQSDPTTTVTVNDTSFFWLRVTVGCESTDPGRPIVHASRTTKVVVAPACDNRPTVSVPSISPPAEDQQRTLTVAATNATDFQWFEGASGDRRKEVSGGRSSSVMVAPLVPTRYWVRAFNKLNTPSCYRDSVDVLVPGCGDIQIEKPVPAELVAPTNSTRKLNASVSGPDDLRFTWKFTEGSATQNARVCQNSNVSTCYIQIPSSPRTYHLVATSQACGTAADSDPVSVELCGPPILRQTTLLPRTNTFFSNGDPILLSIEVEISGSDATYQWFRGAVGDASHPLSEVPLKFSTNGEPVPNSHGAWKITQSTEMRGSETYWVQVTDTCDSVNSSGTRLLCNNCRTRPCCATVSKNVAHPGDTITLTAPVETGFRYEWRTGSFDETVPPFSFDPVATYTVLEMTTFWLRTFDNENIPFDSELLTVTVVPNDDVCDSPVVGAVTSPPRPYVLHNGSIDLYAVSDIDGLSYTWYNGESGDTSSPRAVGSFLRAYITQPVEKVWVRGVDRCGQHDDSRTVNVYMCLPTITQQPEGRMIAAGQTVPLTIAATGGDGLPLPDFAYKWFRSEDVYQQNPLATGASFTPPAATATATYYATVNITCGSAPHFVRSEDATLEVCANPSITPSVPGSITADGQTAMVSVYAEGKELTYQWYQGTPPGGTFIPEATSSYLTVAPQNTTSYWCRVTSQGVCTSDSPAIPVTVCRPPVIDTPPASRRIFKNTSTTLGVVAHEVTDTPETYQWSQRSGSSSWTEIPGATSTSFTTPLLSSETEYRVRVSAGLCSVNSPTATISMCTYPEILTVAKDRNVSAGDAVTLTVNDISPVYDKNVTWFQGASGVRTTPLTSGLNRTLTVAPTTTTQYWAEVDHQGCVSRTSTITVNVCVPKITVNPVGRTVAAGTPTTLTVGAGGAPGLTYQWYKGQPGDVTQPIAGATSSSLTVSPASTTLYWARATGTCGSSADSAAATITVCSAPVITGTSGPTIYTRAGSPALLSVATTGNNLSYQWHNGPSGTISPIPDATSVYHSVSPAATSSYWARVYSDGVCFANSGTITVDVCSNPTITAQPQAKVIRTGQATTLSVTASSSTGSLTYQWYQGASGNTSSPIAGAASSSYTTPTLTADTSYWVRVTRGACSTDSAAAPVTVCKITASTGSNVNSASGQPVNVAVSVGNSRVAQPYVTWYAGSSGNTSTSVQGGPGLMQITVAPAATTSYWARVNDGTCPIDSNAMTVNVCKPTITTQPAGVMINSGQSAVLSAAASGAPLTYQWYTGTPGVTTSPIAGATGTSLTVSPAATTSYWLRASGCAGSTADSAPATVEVCVPPTAPMPTASGPQPVGTSAYVSNAASGTDLTYQWYRGLSGDTSLPLGGGTDSTYVFNAMSSAYYWVRVTGRCGTANSPAVLHNVNPQITKHPQSAAVVSGSTVTLNVQASGTYPGYQWYRGSSGDTSNPIAGATSTTYTTPALTANTSYWCRVTSGTSGAANSNTATITMCSGPSVTAFYSQYLGSNCWDLYVNVGTAWKGNVIYSWYKGVPGDVARSTFIMEAGSSGYRLAWQCVTEPTTYWVRLWTFDRSCYRDTGGFTLSPVE